MKIGLDIDGTITAHPEFFSKLTQLWDDEVYAVTYRCKNKQRDLEELNQLGVKVTDILYAEDPSHKAVLCKENNIKVLFDDMPEMLKYCDENIVAFLVRGEDNFDLTDQKFVFNKEDVKVH